MQDTKVWWQSRTIWLQIVAAAFAILSAFKLLPSGISQEQVVSAIMTIVAIATVILRLRTTATIGAPNSLSPAAAGQADSAGPTA